MPNRIIKESLCTSDKIAALSDFEFRLWIGLITQADDAGRGDARPAIIKGSVFPLRERVTIKDIERALHGLADNSCVSLYTVGGKPYYCFPTWAAHQRIRDCRPKYPAPEENDAPPQSAATCGKWPPESNPNPNPNPNTESESNPKESARTRTAFHPPTVEEVAEYCATRQNNIDAELFVAHYTARGWKISGGTPMKDWKAAVITWEKRDKQERGMPF